MSDANTPVPATPRDGTAWVTGASSGIGRFVALELSRRGWTVIATARREEDLASLAREAGAGAIVPMAGDIVDRDAMAALVRDAEAAHGPIARAVLNAGVYIVEAEKSLSAEAITKTFDINIGGTVNCLAAVLPAMEGRRRGQVAITASVAGYGGLPLSLGYGPTKAALINLAESLRLTYGPRGLLVQLICPGFVKTPLTDKNKFPMPFLVPVEKAARIICDGLDGATFEIAFPRRLAWLLKAINLLPYAAYFPIVAKVTGGERGAADRSVKAHPPAR